MMTQMPHANATPFRLDRTMMISVPSADQEDAGRRIMRLRGTSLRVADALAGTDLRFSLVPQPTRRLRFIP